MRILQGIDALRELPPGAVLTIGNFDGLHRGHQRLLEICRERASERRVVVVTFEPHPLTVLRPAAVPPRLTTPEMKQELIEAQGVDAYIVLPPEPSVLNLTAEDFWAMIRDQVRPAFIIEGPGFTFGKGRLGNGKKLAEWSAGSAVRFEQIEPVKVALLDLSLVAANSSLIRWLLSNGRVRDAAICLGQPYTLRGKVIKGYGRGRTIGVPTANLESEGQCIPADGVYAGRCRVDGRAFTAAVSIGDMPTFNDGKRQIEAHLLDFEGDLYGRSVDLELVDWLREQRKFSGIQALKSGIAVDLEQTRRRSALDPSEPIAVAELTTAR